MHRRLRGADAPQGAQDEPVAILSESQSRPLNLHLAEPALDRLGARPFHVRIPSARRKAPVRYARCRGSRRPDALERLVAEPALEGKVEATVRLAKAISLQGTDAELIRRHFGAWADPDVYATAHVGWA